MSKNTLNKRQATFMEPKMHSENGAKFLFFLYQPH